MNRKISLISLAIILIVAGGVGVYVWQQSKSGIKGIVLLGPICPVERIPPDPACAEKLYQTRLVLTSADQAFVIKEFSSDASGRFSVEVPPGKYTIRSAAAADVLPFCSTDTISVGAGQFVNVTVHCDTGIR